MTSATRNLGPQPDQPHYLGSLPLTDFLDRYPPRSTTPGWTWDDAEREILQRECLCCGKTGHYQRQLERFLAENGLTEGVYVGEDGTLWDGHHRVVAARRLGIAEIPLESREQAEARWLRDHGPVSWEDRRFGDRARQTTEREIGA